MANLIVSPVIDLVIQKVAAFLEDRIELHSGVEGKLKKLETVLNRIQPVANTADDVDLEKHKDLKPWMRDLKLAAEEANDVLDVFEYLHLKRQAEGDGLDDEVLCSPSPSKRLKSIIPSSLYNYAKKITPSTYPLERLGNIQSKLEELDSRAVQFLLVVADRKATDRVHHNQDVRNRETSSSVVDPDLVGRKELLEEIICKLMEEEEEEEEEHITVIPVVGHGGMGKTTLAQHIFNNTRVESHFQVRMWAHVSQVFDVWTLTKKIIESASRTEKCADTDSLETLQHKLKDVLKSKRFLLVLDDLWYDRNKFVMEEEWNKLCSPLAEAGGKGSKILLTSRTPEVKELPSGALKTMISLPGLTQDECWSIIQTSVFRGSGISDGCQDLVPIGRQIALKVQGSPLAAKAVGGILRKELSWRHWSNILNTELSKLQGNGVMPVLRLSYQYLPTHLRQCFAYCSLFPKGHKFDVDMLVRMWVAHGYIRDRSYGEMLEEDIGKSYFDDLLSAGFFTRQIFDCVVMHDLMNDLAGFVTKDEIIRIEDTQNCPIPKTVRHLSIRTDYLAELNKIRCNLSDLETFLFFQSSDGGFSLDLNDKLVKNMLQQLRRVCVLDLRLCKVKELPDDISDLVHLRYLDISGTCIRRIPDTIWRLYHLQVLDIVGRYEQREFEICSLEKLTNLLNLRFVGTSYNCLFVDLAFIKGLKYLQVARNLRVKEGRGSEIGNLKALDGLTESLDIDGLQYIESPDAAREADLCGKKRLLVLHLQWGGHCNPDVATEVLEGLQPPSSLEELRIENYPGKVCPNWVSIPSLQNLKSMSLSNLVHLECLPPLGQQLPLLRSLYLSRLPRVKKLSLEGLSSLNNILIGNMVELEEWSAPDGTGVLPCLRFRIYNCPKMRVLPALSDTVTALWITAVGISSLPELVHQPIANSGSSSSSFSSELSTLHIADCGNLTSLDSGLLQNQLLKLSDIEIVGCELLVSLPDEGFREFSSLKRLTIEDCPNLTWPASRQDVDCGLLPTSLEELKISHIDGKVLSGYLHGLSSLSTLSIRRCPCLKAILSSEGQGYRTSLLELSIYSCEALTPSELEEGLHALPSLKVLRIGDCPGLLVETSSISAPDDSERMAIRPVPLALEDLQIDDPLVLVNVLILKSLTSVQQFCISHASRLISFSLELEEWLLQNGTTLKRLTIAKAQQLQSLPKLPYSLEELFIWNADEDFKKRYEKDTGCDWYKIRHIRFIHIN